MYLGQQWEMTQVLGTLNLALSRKCLQNMVFLFKDLFLLSKRQIYREERHRERSSICWFTPQVAEADAKPLEIGASSREGKGSEVART